MTSSYRIRQLAENDLEQIWLYSFHEWGLAQADSYIRLMIGRFRGLQKIHSLACGGMTLSPAIIVFQKQACDFLYHYKKRHRYYRHSSSAHGHY
jgi:hypothetical protein